MFRGNVLEKDTKGSKSKKDGLSAYQTHSCHYSFCGTRCSPQPINKNPLDDMWMMFFFAEGGQYPSKSAVFVQSQNYCLISNLIIFDRRTAVEMVEEV